MKNIGNKKKNISLIIMAAGESSRMGFPKLALKYNENTTFIEHILDEYKQFGCEKFIIVVNEIGANFLKGITLSPNVEIVMNDHSDWHRFYSLKLGSKKLQHNSVCFVHNVDNPFVSQGVLKKLLTNLSEGDYVSPCYKSKGGHPILLSSKVIDNLQLTNESQLHFKEYLTKFSKKEIDVRDEKILVNINTQEEYNSYFNKNNPV